MWAWRGHIMTARFRPNVVLTHQLLACQAHLA